MGAFEYTALDKKGREKKGVLEADTSRQVRQSLRDQGLMPLSVEEVAQKEKRSAGRRTLFRRGLSGADLSLFTRQLATLVQSGLPVEEALRACANQTDRARAKSTILAVRSKVMEGHPLAGALSEFPHVFSELYRATVAAGEQAGHLDKVLDRLADYTESRQDLGQKMITALIYPVILLVVATAVVVGLLTYVVPQVVEVFADMDQKLPLMTVIMIGISDFLKQWGYLLLIALVGAIVAYRYMMRLPGPRFAIHGFYLRAPLIARLVRGVNAARFARTFSILASSGVPILDALRITAEVVVNLPMKQAVEQAARKVREGTNLNKALDQSGLFPPMMIHLIASGEASGRLEEMLERAAHTQERELDTLRQVMLGIFEPVIILVMGGVVLAIVLAILLPILQINQLVQ